MPYAAGNSSQTWCVPVTQQNSASPPAHPWERRDSTRVPFCAEEVMEDSNSRRFTHFVRETHEPTTRGPVRTIQSRAGHGHGANASKHLVRPIKTNAETFFEARRLSAVEQCSVPCLNMPLF